MSSLLFSLFTLKLSDSETEAKSFYLEDESFVVYEEDNNRAGDNGIIRSNHTTTSWD